MSKHRRVRMTRVDAERVLDTGVGGSEPLAALLAAATPSRTSGEVAGERAVLTAFRAAQLGGAPSRRARMMLKTVLANLAAAKVVLAATAAAAATGGIAVVAATGHLPGTGQHAHHKQHGSGPVALNSSDETSRHAAKPHNKPAPTPSSSAAARPSGTPSRLLSRLCSAFQEEATGMPGRALDSPAFSVLVSAAGGKDNVAAYCVSIIGPGRTHPNGAWPDDPNHDGWPGDANQRSPEDPNHGGVPSDPSRDRPTDSNHHRRTHRGDDRSSRPTGTPYPQPTDAPPTAPKSAPSSPGRP